MFLHSPSGKLVQIEYALAAVGAGAPSVGIKGLLIEYGESIVNMFILQHPTVLFWQLKRNKSP